MRSADHDDVIDLRERLETVRGDRAGRDLVALDRVGDERVLVGAERLEVAELTAELDGDVHGLADGWQVGERLRVVRMERAV